MTRLVGYQQFIEGASDQIEERGLEVVENFVYAPNGQGMVDWVSFSGTLPSERDERKFMRFDMNAGTVLCSGTPTALAHAAFLADLSPGHSGVFQRKEVRRSEFNEWLEKSFASDEYLGLDFPRGYLNADYVDLITVAELLEIGNPWHQV